MAAVPGSPESPGSPYHPTTARDAAARGAAGLRGQPTPSEVIAGLRATSHGDDLVQLLSPEGTLTAHEDFPFEVDADLLRGLYRDMVLVRRFDREGNALQRQGQLSIWVPLLGQEAAQIGAGRALRPGDMAFPSYREHGVAWCRGVDPTQLLGIFRGTDHCGWDPKATRFNCYTIVIGNQVLNATGYAMGQRFDGAIGSPEADGESRNEATIAFFGDGATSQGDVHEGMVFAAAFDAPVVFYCQNNQWAISEPVGKQSRVPLWQRSTGYGFPGVRVDGNDVVACLAVTRWALEECRSGNGPVMIEAFTYRMDAHTTSDDRPGTGWPTRNSTGNCWTRSSGSRCTCPGRAWPTRSSSTRSGPRPTNWPPGSGRTASRCPNHRRNGSSPTSTPSRTTNSSSSRPSTWCTWPRSRTRAPRRPGR